jgi:hypothetical protein
VQDEGLTERLPQAQLGPARWVGVTKCVPLSCVN